MEPETRRTDSANNWAEQNKLLNKDGKQVKKDSV